MDEREGLGVAGFKREPLREFDGGGVVLPQRGTVFPQGRRGAEGGRAGEKQKPPVATERIGGREGILASPTSGRRESDHG